MSQRPLGKVAVVTGASKGIGAAIAKLLADQGAAVVIDYATSREGAERVVGEINGNGGRAIAVQADVTRPADIQRLFAEAMRAFDKLDILVNNAGTYEFTPLDAITPQHFHKHFDLNVLGLILVTQEAVRHFSPSGGSIINISSIASTIALANACVYSGTKGAVDAVTRSLSAELGPRRIRVNSINPGMIETEGLHAVGFVGTDLARQIEAATPLGRIGHPNDIGPVAVFLASDDSGWVTGESILVSGGAR
jgi:3-oxoacyl-[acyl-carrier protein] reductase